MAKIKNKRIYSNDPQRLKDLQAEYKEYGDWDTEIEGDCLTIFALHRKYQRRKEKKQQERRERRERNMKRREED